MKMKLPSNNKSIIKAQENEFQHTLTPWKVLNHSIVSEHDGIIEAITGLNGYALEANAAFIVKAVNLHDELVNVLKEVLCYVDEPKSDCGICNKGALAGHKPGCVVPAVLKALAKAEAK